MSSGLVQVARTWRDGRLAPERRVRVFERATDAEADNVLRAPCVIFDMHHPLLADWLFVIAAVLFVWTGVLAAIQRPDPTHGALIPFGLALLAVAWLVL